MAQQIDSEFTETIENLIFYRRNGKFLIRTVPVQAAASKKSAKAFGQAASKSKLLRTLLLPLIPYPKDRDMQYRLASAMQKSFSSQQDVDQPDNDPLAGFRFIATSDLKNCLHVSLLITGLPDGRIQLDIPQMNPVDSITAPPGTSRVELHVMAVSFHLDHSKLFAGTPKLINIPYTNETQPFLSVVFETGSKTVSMMVLALALSYWNQNKQIVKEGFMPVEVVAVFKRSGLSFESPV